MNTPITHKLHHRQEGIMSIMVTLIIMSILTLIVVSFAFLVRQEQRESLDRQLSTQAFYAAESGVNDAIKALKVNGNTEITTCDSSDPLPGFSSTLDAATGVKYSCLLVNPAPDSLEFTSIPMTDTAKVVHLQDKNGSPISSIIISWQDTNSAHNQFTSDTNHFLPQASYATDPANATNPQNLAATTGILRATIIPESGAFTRSALLTNSQTLFLYPRGNGGSGVVTGYPFLPGTSSRQGSFVDGACNGGNQGGNTPKYCNVRITGINAATVYLRLSSIYRTASVTVRAFDAAGRQLRLAGSQAIVDSTGKANDVLRRIQERIQLHSDTVPVPPAIETMDSICKRLAVWNGGAITELGGVADPTGACSPN